MNEIFILVNLLGFYLGYLHGYDEHYFEPRILFLKWYSRIEWPIAACSASCPFKQVSDLM